ncbi:MAG: peptidylprolyl isomerase [Trueperaceae bacterium]|nr:peptidylprolyl isomerase [Trueperaceae bacterium]MCO5174390.1 peptidylprolyl isomerase [Trueperaceae bacterium]MCW5819077.1 peptidylprolyl isomerase [Trueperaceae bacterium]
MSDPLAGFQPVAPLSTERQTRFPAAQQVLDQAGKEYRAAVKTNKGDVVLELYADKAPRTVNNFVFLALNHYYDGVVFHRVLEDFMAQTGDPTGTGTGGPGYTFADEFHPDLRHRGVGVLSMANAGPGPRGEGTNGSQFFITFVDTPWLDGKHSVFGKVVSGADVLDRIQRIDPGRRGGAQPDVMEKVEIYAR